MSPDGTPNDNPQNAQGGIRIGIDLGGNDIKLGAANSDATKLLLPELVKVSSEAGGSPDQTVAQVLHGLQIVLERLDANWSALEAVSMTVPCPCTPDGHIIEATNLGSAETQEAWRVPFGELVADKIREASGRDIPVLGCNDANAAALDDDFVRFGHDTRPRTTVFVTTGTGLGGGIVIDGRVHLGRGQAAELGHMKPAIPRPYAERFAYDTPPTCGCGAKDCAETRASLTGLVTRMGWVVSEEGAGFIRKDLAARGETLNEDVLATLRELHAESAKKAAYQVRTFADRDGDALCRWLLEDWAIILGATFASLAAVLHPDLFVIGGGLTEMKAETRDWFIGVVRRVYGEVNSQSCFDSKPGNCEITWSVTQDQGWRGAILMGIRSKTA